MTCIFITVFLAKTKAEKFFLTTKLFELVGIESAVGIFKNTTLGGHAMVFVQLNDLEGQPYRYYSDLTTFHCDSGKWIVIEPQKTLNTQNLTWISYWNLIAAGELDTEHYT